MIRPVTAWLGERTTLLTGLLCGATGFFIYGVAPEGWIFWLGIPIMAFWGLAGPATQALMTRRVSSSEQGQLQGAIASINGLTGLIGPALFTQIFAHFIGPSAVWHLPGAPFLLASLMLLSAGVIAWRATMPGDRPSGTLNQEWNDKRRGGLVSSLVLAARAQKTNLDCQIKGSARSMRAVRDRSRPPPLRGSTSKL